METKVNAPDKLLVAACAAMLLGSFFPLLAMGDKTANLFSSEFSMGVFAQLLALLLLAAPAYVLWGAFKGFANERQQRLAPAMPFAACVLFGLLGKGGGDEMSFFPVMISRGYWLCYIAALWIAVRGLREAVPQDPNARRLIQTIGAVVMVVSLLFMPVASMLSRRGFTELGFSDLLAEKAAGYTFIVLLLGVLVLLAVYAGACANREHPALSGLRRFLSLKPQMAAALPLIGGTAVLVFAFVVLTMIADEDKQAGRIYLETGPYLYLLAAAVVCLAVSASAKTES